MLPAIRLFVLLTILVTKSFAQPFSAYVNDKEEFYIMDSTSITQVDFLKPLSYKIGANCVAYVDNTQNFKIYQDGRVRQIAEGYVQNYSMSTDLVTIQANKMLYVYDDGKLLLLSQIIDSYVDGDSIVAFYDKEKYEFNCYWNGKIMKLEEGIGGNPVVFMNAGDNIIAYSNTYNNFRIVYRGEVIEQESQRAQSTRCGANTVAYVSHDNTFKIFYLGETYELSSFATRNYQCGDGLVAYIDNSGNFNIFDEGDVIEVGYFSPSYLRVIDEMVVYADATGGLNVYYNGETKRLENYIPTDLKISSNSLAYTDESKRVQFFSYGKNIELPNFNVEGIELDYDVLKIKTGFNSYRFFWKNYSVP